MTTGPAIEDLHILDAPQVGSLPGPETRKLLDEQERRESATVTYPKSLPFAPVEGRGSTLRDEDGNVFLDFASGAGVNNVGHSNPYITDAVVEQTERLTHTLDFPTETRMELLRRLNEILPSGLADNCSVAFGGPTGSDAIEASMKLAIHATGGDGFLAFRGGNHGQTAGALSLSSVRKYKEVMPGIANVSHARYPYPFQQECTPEEAVDRALEDVRTALSDPYGGLTDPAGIWVEPIQGSGGVVVPPKRFLRELRELADEHDIPLVFDEIQTGVGRTGQWFAADWYDVTPDVLVCGKAIGGGLPLSLVAFHEDLDVWKPGSHKGTFRGYLPAMAASTRSIEYIRDRDLLSHARSVGSTIRARLEEAAESNAAVGDVRGKGLLFGIEFVDDDREPDTERARAIQRVCFENGVILWTAGRYGNVLRGLPPLVTTDDQAERGAELIASAIEDVATRSP